MTKEHRAAIDRLSTRPGTCHCGATLLCVRLEPWAGEGHPHPEPRFACPKHDVWLGFCFDDGYADDPEYKLGSYEATLRDVADPAWAWLPKHIRRAAVDAGFSVRHDEYPRFRIAACRGRTWATDGRLMIDIGLDTEISAALARSGIVAFPPSETRKALNDHVLDGSYVEKALRLVAPNCFADCTFTEGMPYVACGSALLAGPYVDFVTAVHPEVTWYAGQRLDAVCAKHGAQVRAVLMPIDMKARAALN